MTKNAKDNEIHHNLMLSMAEIFYLLYVRNDGCSDRVLAARLSRAGDGKKGQQRVARPCDKHSDAGHARHAVGQGSSLVKHYACNLCSTNEEPVTNSAEQHISTRQKFT